jgi:predicted GNAT superfamily acetyltransferase
MADIRLIDDAVGTRRVSALVDEVWGASTPLLGVELVRAIGHAGGYVAAAYVDDRIVGASLGFLATHCGEPALHSHVTGILSSVRATGLGRELKLHQQAWAASRGLRWVTWTFDPLVDFYGPIDDSINARDESDRLFVAWGTTTSPRDTRHLEQDAVPPGAVAVATPDDIVALRRVDPPAAERWRHRLRDELGGPLAAGARVAGFTRGGEYVLEVSE